MTDKQLAVKYGRRIYILSAREAVAWQHMSAAAQDKLIARKDAAGEYEELK